MVKKSEFIFILISFFIWRVGILVVAYLSVRFLPLFSHNYLGGGYSNYILNPLFWGHVNFDGEHYLAIAQNGYQPFEYFFFPLLSNIVRNFSASHSQMGLAANGLFISNFSFFVALFGIYKLVKLDYSDAIAKLVIILFLVFPTSFYFGTFYTESLFLSLVVWCFYFARKQKYLFASILASFASGTRVIGAVLLPAILIEYLLSTKKTLVNFFEIMIISPIGLLYYMYFLLKQTGDPLIFVHQVSIFGEQRSSTLILLPQVFYRYIFEVLPRVSYLYFPNVFTTYMEFILAIFFLLLIILSVFKLRSSYSLYSAIAFIVPTLAGSFSSMPRYILVIFPVFILVATYMIKLPKVYIYLIIFVMLILMAISTALFWRGYWIS